MSTKQQQVIRDATPLPTDLADLLDAFTGYEVNYTTKERWYNLGQQVLRGYQQWLANRLGEIRPNEYACKRSIWCWVGQEFHTNLPAKWKHLAGYLQDPIQFSELMWFLNGKFPRGLASDDCE
jgi:hypothetical protein